MSKLIKKTISLLLAGAMTISLLPNLTGCGNSENTKVTETDSTPTEGYYAVDSLSWNESGKYTDTISIAEDSIITFNELKSSDFNLKVTKSNSESTADAYELSLSGFNVVRTDSRTLSFEFTTPLNNDLEYIYTFTSAKAVTSDDKYIEVKLGIEEPEITVSTTSTGAYCGSSNMELELTLSDNAKFANSLNSSMLELPDGFTGEVTFKRTGDNSATISIDNLPEDLSAGTFLVVLSSAAINSGFAKDMHIAVDIIQPALTVVEDSIVIDDAAKTITFGKMYLPIGLTGFDADENDSPIYSLNTNNELTNVTYNKEDNFYSATIKINGATGDKLTDEDLENLELVASMKNGEEYITYSFNPYIAPVNMYGTVIDDEDEKTVTITLSAYGGSFVSDITADDFTITYSGDSLSNLTFVEATEDEVVFSATYSEGQEISTFINFSLPESKMTGKLVYGGYTTTVCVCVYEADRDFDFSDLAKGIGSGILSSIGSKIGGAFLPYVYNFLGVNTSDSEISAVSTQISALTKELSSITYKINELRSQIKIETYKTDLTLYQNQENQLYSYANTFFNSSAVFAYASEAINEKDVDTSYTGFSEFYSILKKVGIYSTSINDLSAEELLKAIDQYNAFYELVQENKSNITSRKIVDMIAKTVSTEIYVVRYSVSRYNKLSLFNQDMIKLSEATEYGKAPSAHLISTTNSHADEFIATVEKQFVTPDDYIGKVLTLGSYIIGSASGSGIGVLSEFFEVVNSYYNFESQTTEIKKSFLEKAQYVYDVTAAVAYSYAMETNDGNKEVLATQIVAVNKIFNEMWQIITDDETRATEKNDILLVANAVVSKAMICTDITSYTSPVGSGSVSLTLDMLETIVQRASDRGLTLAQDLKNAGFTNITENSTGEYLFIPCTIWSTLKLASTIKDIGSFFGYTYESATYTYYSDVLIQKGTSVTKKSNVELCAVHVYSNYWKSNDTSSWSHSYNKVLSFARASS